MSYTICVSGAAGGDSVEEGKDEALEVGAAIARSGHTLITGATVGLPNYAAQGCKAAGGQSVGLSPAATKLEHVRKYRLPTEAYDFILYTGLHYVGRDALLVNSSDAVISLGGRLGTLHEFTIAMETDTPIGFITGTGGVTDLIELILEKAGRRFYQEVIYEDDPARLVKKIIAKLDHEHKAHADLHKFDPLPRAPQKQTRRRG